MEPRDYQDRFHEALQRAFASTNPAVRGAYFELASFYREKIGEQLLLQNRGLFDLLEARAAARERWEA